MTIQERKNNIYHDYGVDVGEISATKIRDLITELDQLADDLEDQEALVDAMKNDMLHAIDEIVQKYKEHFSIISLFGVDVDNMTNEDIDFVE